MSEYKFSLTKSQIELAQSEYPLDRTWWCKHCDQICIPKVIDVGNMPNRPQAQAVSSCCEFSMTDIDPKIAYEERTGRCFICKAELKSDGTCPRSFTTA